MKPDCSIVKDLLPLYVENMVSDETAQYVKEHLNVCASCQGELINLRDTLSMPQIKDEKSLDTENAKPFQTIMKRLNRQFYSLAYAALIFLIFLGFGWTDGNHLLYNSVIMPIVGIFGYYVFRWKAIYKVPTLLLLIDLAIFAFQLIEIGFMDTLSWTLIYSIFILVGVAIAFLLHYAFKKEEVK